MSPVAVSLLSEVAGDSKKTSEKKAFNLDLVPDGQKQEKEGENMKRWFAFTITVFLLSLTVWPCHAEITMRCSSRIISPEDSRLKVHQYCGEPLLMESTGFSIRNRTFGGGELENVDTGEITPVSKWTYLQNNYYYRVVFFGDVVQRIEKVFKQ